MLSVTHCELSVATRDPDIRAKGILGRRAIDRIYTRLAQTQMKLFRQIDERDVIIRLYLYSLAAVLREFNHRASVLNMVFSPVLYGFST